MDAIEVVIQTIHEQQEPTFNEQTGRKNWKPKRKKNSVLFMIKTQIMHICYCFHQKTKTKTKHK